MSRRWEMCISLIKSGCALLGTLMLVSVPIKIRGQELVTSRMDGHTPSGLTAGSPVGSYPVSGFESVNPYNGALNFQFPLLRIGGRGSAGYTMMLPIETKWNVERHVWPPPNPTCSTGLCPWQNEQTNPVDFHMPGLVQSAERYKPGKLETRSSGEGYTDCSPNNTTVYYITTLTRFTFTLADGTQIEFRDAATGGEPRPNPMGSQCQSGMGFNRGKVFFAGDGSAATFISDEDVKDSTPAGDGSASPTGHVRFSDGTTYRIEGGEIVWIRDRNGNKVTPTTDALGRQVTVTLTDYQTTLFDQISYKGFGGAQRNIKVWYGPLSEILRVTQPGDSATIKTYYQLFPGLNIPGLSNPDFNPFLVRRLELPDGRNYRFFYNVYAELTRIELPTGGAIEYDYDGGLTAGTSGVLNPSNPGIYRRVIERRIYSDATTLNSLEGKTTFSRPATDVDFVDVSELSATGILLSRVRHFYHSHAANSFFVAHFPNEYTEWREGKEYKTEFYDANNNLLNRVENVWEQTPATGAANNPHITRTTTP